MLCLYPCNLIFKTIFPFIGVVLEVFIFFFSFVVYPLGGTIASGYWVWVWTWWCMGYQYGVIQGIHWHQSGNFFFFFTRFLYGLFDDAWATHIELFKEVTNIRQVIFFFFFPHFFMVYLIFVNLQMFYGLCSSILDKRTFCDELSLPVFLLCHVYV